MSSDSFLPTPEQQTVIHHDGSAFVMACPGAGKTHVMTERARILFADMPAGRGVAFLSFTNSAIFELETRLRHVGVLPSPIFPSFIGTFDSFVWQFLVAPFGIKGSDARPRLIADLDEISVEPFSGAHPLPLSCFCPIKGTIIEQAAKKCGFDISEKPASQLKAYVAAAAAIRTSLRERTQLGFNEARSIALERLKDSGAGSRIIKALASRFLEIIVDEAQDCNPDDLEIISRLRDSNLPVKIVCDPYQSIYKFRGGVTDQLLFFSESFHEYERKNLTGNFRSTPNICKATAQFRPLSSRTMPDEPIGQYKSDTTPIRILSYPGQAVSPSIGIAFCDILKEEGVDFSLSPIIAATKASGTAAIGQPRESKRRDRTVRLVEAVTGFYFASGFNDIKKSIDEVHQILLELEDQLDETTYQQYLENNNIEVTSWRPKVLFLLRELRFNPLKHADAKAWHDAAKDILTKHLTIGSGPSLSQRFRWNQAIADFLVPLPNLTVIPRTIHSVKGMQFPAVCVVTTPPTLKSILDYLETGEPLDKAEDARKLYVATSRAEKLLVIAAPKSQAKRLKKHLATQGAEVEIKEI